MSFEEGQSYLITKRTTQKEYYDRRHRAVPLAEIHQGQDIFVSPSQPNTYIPGIIILPASQSRSYIIKSQGRQCYRTAHHIYTFNYTANTLFLRSHTDPQPVTTAPITRPKTQHITIKTATTWQHQKRTTISHIQRQQTSKHTPFHNHKHHLHAFHDHRHQLAAFQDHKHQQMLHSQLHYHHSNQVLKHLAITYDQPQQNWAVKDHHSEINTSTHTSTSASTHNSSMHSESSTYHSTSFTDSDSDMIFQHS